MEKIFDRNFSDERYLVGHYEKWTELRIEKIEKIFGEDFLKNKKILEVACGFGDIGKYFRKKYNCDVTFTEGREENVFFTQKNNPDCKVLLVNHEYEWPSTLGKFDMIIHFGLSYHLDNWKNDLCSALDRTDLLIFESEVSDSFNENFEIKFIDLDSWDQAVGKNGIKLATKASAKNIENVFREKNFNYIRFDTKDLDNGLHEYSWEEKGSVENLETYSSFSEIGLRRFWVAFKNIEIYENFIKPSHENEIFSTKLNK